MIHHTQTALPEPRWRGLEQLRSGDLPAGVEPWLRDDGSLTRALLHACEGRFRVDVLSQGWGRGLAGERRLLGVSPGLFSMVREVKLRCEEIPWVFARTLIPATSLRGPARQLATLRSRPLGAVLFSDPRTRRLNVQVARLTPRHALFAAACSHLSSPPAEIWGRRTLFSFAAQPLLVNEIFLPVIPARTS